MRGPSKQTRGWSALLLGGLLSLACGGEAEVLEGNSPSREDVEAGLHGPGSQGPYPNWATPTFATDAQVAEDGNQFFVAWSDGRPGRFYAARVSKNGRLLDPDAIPLNPGLRPDAYYHATAFDGRQFLVVWTGDTSIFLTRVNRNGTLDGPPVTLFTPTDHQPAGSPGIACHERKCLVAWIGFGGTATGAVRGITLNTAKPGFDVQEVFISNQLSAINSYGVAVAWSHDRYLATWTDSRFGGQDIFAARIRRTGAVLDPDGFVISAAPGNQNFSAVTATKQGFFVAWSDARNGTPDIYGARVKDGTANVLDPSGIPIATSSTNDITPKVASEGHQVLVTWSALTADTGRVRGARVKLNGDVRDRHGFAISRGAAARQLVSGNVAYANDKYFVVYGRAPVLDEPPYQVIVGTRLKQDDVLDIPAIRISHAPSVEQLAP
ncbi:putative lipoprotein [Myxococcus xanthus DK 1622]|uniref:Lipoprotein n=1 Tax=Myxococcus xanthus (strain DK1622) TaxID=246197 RepID=Q1DAB7_MYXXD|nr:putative lipoprotein [Myxococcus xanthus DK 1622]QZZ49910.1 hypothetical protein MyxoNM_11950 [Myxococcus xanthus]SDX02969.1 hypothetical protein SAMN05444383_104640 [Myxococcus xanthus]